MLDVNTQSVLHNCCVHFNQSSVYNRFYMLQVNRSARLHVPWETVFKISEPRQRVLNISSAAKKVMRGSAYIIYRKMTRDEVGER